MKKRTSILILSLILLFSFSLIIIPTVSLADHNLEHDLDTGVISNEKYNRLKLEEERLQRLENQINLNRTQIDLRRNDLQNPDLTPERRQEIEAEIARLEAEIARTRQELRSADRTQDEKIQSARTKAAAASKKCFSLLNFSLEACVEGVISAVGEFFKQILGLVLWLAGKFFDKSVEYSITSFSVLANSDSIKIGWKTLRDVANLFFIFILLYAAIGMILQLPSVNGKRILVSVIVVALLINFSAFFTRLVIDASNVAANQFYNAISKSETGISATFLNALPIHSALTATPGRTIINAVGISFGVVIMMLVAIFVFLAAAILFVVRTVSLLFVIILSPLAFLMYAFPNQKGLFDKWLDTLLKQAFFAPLYLLMVWITIKFLKGGALEQILAQEGSSPVLITLYFLIAIGFMFGALIIAKSLGAKGASAAMKGAGALTGAATGAVGGATKYGLRKAGAIAGWVGEKAGQKAPRVASTLKTISGGVSKTVKAVEKVVPGVGIVRKGVTEAIKSPLKTTAEGLAKVTKDYGVGGILGRTKDEEAEARKKAEEKKKEEKKIKLKQTEENLEKLSPTATDAEITPVLHDLNPKDTAEINIDTLSKPHIAKHLKASQLAEISKSVKGTHSSTIRNAITTAVAPAVPAGAPAGTPPVPTAGTPEQLQAYKWLTQSPAGTIF